jgi:hypothetical protein
MSQPSFVEVTLGGWSRWDPEMFVAMRRMERK